MKNLKKVWMATLTKNVKDAGTNNGIVLILNDGGHVDNVHFTFRKRSAQATYLDSGEANLFAVKLNETNNFGARTINPSRIKNGGVRIAIRGDNEWQPQHCIVWGKDEDNRVIPIAMEENMSQRLSTDSQESKISLPLRKVGTGKSKSTIRRLLLVVETQQVSFPGEKNPDPKRFETGTDSPIKIRIKDRRGRLLVDHTIGNTSQTDLEPGKSNFHIIPVLTNFSKNDLKTDSIELSILGDDSWLPNELYLFGLVSASGRSTNIISLVNIDKWEEGRMSTNLADGAGSINSKEKITLKLLSDAESFGIGKDSFKISQFGTTGTIVK